MFFCVCKFNFCTKRYKGCDKFEDKRRAQFGAHVSQFTDLKASRITNGVYYDENTQKQEMYTEPLNDYSGEVWIINKDGEYFVGFVSVYTGTADMVQCRNYEDAVKLGMLFYAGKLVKKNRIMINKSEPVQFRPFATGLYTKSLGKTVKLPVITDESIVKGKDYDSQIYNINILCSSNSKNDKFFVYDLYWNRKFTACFCTAMNNQYGIVLEGLHLDEYGGCTYQEIPVMSFMQKVYKKGSFSAKCWPDKTLKKHIIER